MAFDTNAGVQGGMAGASLGPYGAAAGFVLGGFLGGSYAKGNKRRQKTLERKIARRQTPQYLQQRIQEYTPIAREAVLNSGAGNVLQQQVQSNISRRGLTGTGVGTAFQNAAALVPSSLAAESAQTMASNSIQNEISGIQSMGTYNPQEIATLSRQSAGDIATAIAIFRSLKGKGNVRGNQNQGGNGPSGSPSWRPGSWNPNDPLNGWNPNGAMGGGAYRPARFPGATGSSVLS